MLVGVKLVNGLGLFNTYKSRKTALLPETKIRYPSLYFYGLPVLMGNFQQHITCSTATGIAVGGIAYHFGVDPSACLVAAGLCSFAGMLPDIDSNTSKSFQECLYLTAGVGCILAASRLRYHGIDPDLAMLGGAVIFLLLRFGLGTLIKKYTSHRGMIHSVPAAILCGQLIFFVVTGDVAERLVKAAALTIGFLSHLILDEVYSIDSSGSSIRLKRSFGTALKWTNPKNKGLVTALYALIFCLGYGIYTNPEVMERTEHRSEMTAQAEVSEHSEVQQAAFEFLSEQNFPPQITQSYPQAVAIPAVSAPAMHQQPVSELPPAMQISESNDWNRRLPLQPAAIVLQ